MAHHGFAESYDKCHKTKNGKGCIKWSKSSICKVDGCKYSCWPDVFSCCKCDSSSCFPSASKVSLESGKSVTMSELQLGDWVKQVKVFTIHKVWGKIIFLHLCVILFTVGWLPSMHWEGGLASQHVLGRGLASQHALGMGVASEHALELGKAGSMHPIGMLSC